MKHTCIRRIGNALSIAVIGVWGVDYAAHWLFSSPMETPAYFFAKTTLYIVFSLLFLSFVRVEKNEFAKVLSGGVVVALLWGAYYNILPLFFDYYPFGIPLAGLTFLNMGNFGTGVAFGTVHTLAFIVGYYAYRLFVRYTPWTCAANPLSPRSSSAASR